VFYTKPEVMSQIQNAAGRLVSYSRDILNLNLTTITWWHF